MMDEYRNYEDEDNITETPNTLPYPHHVGSSLIEPENTSGFISRGIDKVNREMKNRVEKLKEEYDKILEELKWNETVYKSEINFEPLIGETYHLYKRDNGKTFLSLIPPSQWKKELIGSFKLNSELKWEKL